MDPAKFCTPTMIDNLRRAWGDLLAPLTDATLSAAYHDFYYSEYSGNNDERLPEFLKDFGHIDTVIEKEPKPEFVPSIERGGYQKPVINRVVAADVRKFRAHVARHPENSNVADWYQELAVRSAIYPGKGTPFGLMYCTLGLAEAGEVQNKAKKAFRDDEVIVFEDRTDYTDGTYSITVACKAITPERRKQLIKELGGNLWYIAATCAEIGTTIGEVMATNLEEIASRSERGTLSGDGDNR